jgi:uncharacterized small protein (DUF1192 family)
MFGRTKEWSELETSGEFLPDDEHARAAVLVAELRERLAVVETQLKSQYLSMAAYAQIAQEQVEFARAEARDMTPDDRVAVLHHEIADLRSQLVEMRESHADLLAQLRSSQGAATPSSGMPMPIAAARVDAPFTAPHIDPWLAEPATGSDIDGSGVRPIDELSMY